MPPRSPTLAFDPTPALEQNNKFSFFNPTSRHHSIDNINKEVRFSNQPVAMQGRHSIATSNVPLLPAVSSASHIPKQAFRITNPNPGVDINAYFEQCRNVNEQLRSAHEQERKAWEIERTALKTKIADLEFKLNKARGTQRRLSNDTVGGSSSSFKSDFQIGGVSSNNRVNGTQPASAPLGPTTNGIPPVWQPASPLPVSRVFSNEEDVQHLPSISEDEGGDEISPRTTHESVPVPIEHIDNSLDGIIVKSEGVKSSFDKTKSPPIIISPTHSPSPKPNNDVPRMSIDSSSLLDPLDKKLKLHAGHTPLIFSGPLSNTTSSAGDITPREERPIDPAPTTRPPLRPSENSDSYFSTEDATLTTIKEEQEKRRDLIEAEEVIEEEPQFIPEDDKPLTGPLMLDNKGKSEASHVFLDKLDDRLAEVVRNSQETTPIASPPAVTEVNVQKAQDDDMPMLRLKKSTNFGSAYGMKMPGTM